MPYYDESHPLHRRPLLYPNFIESRAYPLEAPPPLAPSAEAVPPPVGQTLPAAPSMSPLDERSQQSGAALREALSNRPQEPTPKLWQRIAAGALGFAGGYAQAGGRAQINPESLSAAAGGILRPGHARKMREWEGDVAAKQAQHQIDQRQLDDYWKRRQTESDLETEEARRGLIRSQQRKLDMPPTPKEKSYNTYEEYLVDKLNTGTAQERADAQKKLDELKAKPNARERSLTVRESVDHNKGVKYIRFYDSEGKMVKEDTMPNKPRPRAPRSPLIDLTADYRRKQERARQLSGQAQQLHPNDRAKAREWIARQEADPEIVNMALQGIGNPPASGNDETEALMRYLGIGAPTAPAPTAPSTPAPPAPSTSVPANPYRKK